MDIIRGLVAWLRRVGVLVLIGVVAIIYLAFGWVYQQQWQQQKTLADQIAQKGAVLAKPLPGREKLQAEVDRVNSALTLITAQAAFDRLIGIASKSGIDINPGSGMLIIPAATTLEAKVGDGKYRVLSFKNIEVAGAEANVMAFISDLDSGKTLENMALRRVGLLVMSQGEGKPNTGVSASVDVDIYMKPVGK